MTNAQKLEETILASVRAEKDELDLLHGVLYADGRIRRKQADLLVELRGRTANPSLAFEHFFYQAIRDHVLAHDRINGEAAAWLRHVLVSRGKLMHNGRAFLLQLKGEATRVCPEFEELFEEFTEEPAQRKDMP